MSTALSVLNESVELTELEQLILEESQEDEAAFDFIAQRIKMPSGGGNFFDFDDEPLKEFVGIVVLSQKARAFWPGEGTGSPPLCASSNGAAGMANIEDAEQMHLASELPVPHPATQSFTDGGGPYECPNCPLNRWGSDPKGGRGKACKELRRLLILVDGYTAPIMLTLPPTSAKEWDRYCSVLKNKKSAFFAVRTHFGLERMKNQGGIDYSVVRVYKEGDIEEVEKIRAVSAIRKEFRELVAGLPVDEADYDSAESEMDPF